MKAILFDCDGTIADSAGLICTIMDRSFEAHGLTPPAWESTRAIIGLSLDKAILALRPSLSEADVAVLVAGYRHQYRAERARPDFVEHLFPGMRDLVLELSAQDEVFVGMVTGKSRRGVAAITAAHGLKDAFTIIRTADDCPSKPHPAMVLECCAEVGVAPADAIVVGDTTFDMEMARTAGSAALGVAWGSHHREQLERSGAQAVATDVPELRQALAAFIEGGLGIRGTGLDTAPTTAKTWS
ncbi:MAG: HAD-IA family hydrolase [Fulvimarina manganoxydans]|uniref:HAD-IA family hydrolase n=1 Tax=Fulvimarina manganoxydans TaxID=937218 RepID=UPI0023572FAC|nr:HAD-IA family hydrolase [Fulvimarina manganoxydans]MCK5934309.1 HAD-IA family hydrolase [Fulvimarina manganoxydans]